MHLAYTFLGLIIGLTSGMFGVGGSLITTPLLKIIFNIPDIIAIASPLPVTIPTAIAGGISYQKSGLTNYKIAAGSIIGGMPASILGAYCTKFINGNLLLLLTGLLIIITGFRLLKKESSLIINLPKSSYIFLISVIIGVLAGFTSGLLAVGGGIILIPVYILVLGLTIQEAAATSLFCISFFAIPGTIVHWHLHHINWLIVLYLSIGTIPASYLGAKIALKIKSEQLKFMFSIFFIIFGIYFTLKQLNI